MSNGGDKVRSAENDGVVVIRRNSKRSDGANGRSLKYNKIQHFLLSGVSFTGILRLTLIHFFKNLSLKFDFNHQTFRTTVVDKQGIQLKTRSE